LFTDLFYKIGSKNVSEKEGIKIKIESYNVGMFHASQKKLDRNECRQNIINHILEENPDIACLQEFSVESFKQADTLLKTIYPYRFYHLFKVRNNRFFGNITFSKFPIFDTGKISFKESTNLSIYTDINHFGRKIRVYNNHLESYNISFTSLVKRFGNKDINSEKIKNDIKDVHEKMLGTFIKRSDQVNLILDNIKRSNHPAIICGDFNDTPMSYTYHMLSIGRKDTFKESGKGFGSTFYHLWPLLRIDYILYPKEYESINHKINRQEFSDHYPISAEIII
jgi:Metal-dependent hydrolase